MSAAPDDRLQHLLVGVRDLLHLLVNASRRRSAISQTSGHDFRRRSRISYPAARRGQHDFAALDPFRRWGQTNAPLVDSPRRAREVLPCASIVSPPVTPFASITVWSSRRRLLLFPETAPLSPSFVPLNDDLEKAFETSAGAAQAAGPGAHQDARLATTASIRSSAVRQGGGGRRRRPARGDLQDCFPRRPDRRDGAVRRAADRADGGAHRSHRARARRADIDAFRTEWLPRLTRRSRVLEDADAEQGAAHEAYVDGLRHRACRSGGEHFVAVDKIAGAVRSAFPGRPGRAGSVFPAMNEGEAEAPTSRRLRRVPACVRGQARRDHPAAVRALVPAPAHPPGRRSPRAPA